MKDNKLKTIYVCSNCGESSPRWMGRCPSCGAWNTMVEDVVVPEPKASARSASARPSGVTSITARRLSEVSTTEEKSRIVTGSGEEIESQEAEAVYLTGFLKPAATVLADGTELDVWQYEHATAYAAADGTEVLRVSEPSGPADTYYSGLSLSDLGEAAQENIAAWFEARGVRYDEQAELERAYAAWSESEDASDFQTWGLSQRIVPTAMSERVIYFLTTVDRPVGNFVMEQQRIGTAFDRETGEYIDNSELFSCPPGELASRIMELSQMSDSELTAQAEAAFSPERAVLFEDHMEINYERGALPAEENSFTIVLDLDEDVKALLHPWAVPQETPEE